MSVDFNHKLAAGLVLAGGQSVRMGQNKALLTWQGLPLWQYQQQQLQNIVGKVWVSGFDLPDRFANKGPLAALDALFAAQPELQQCLVVAVDMPLLLLSDYQRLLTTPGSAFFSDYFVPMKIEITPTMRQYVADAMLSEHKSARSLHQFLHAHDATALSAPTERLVNLNTPDVYQRAVQTTQTIQTTQLTNSSISY